MTDQLTVRQAAQWLKLWQPRKTANKFDRMSRGASYEAIRQAIQRDKLKARPIKSGTRVVCWQISIADLETWYKSE